MQLNPAAGSMLQQTFDDCKHDDCVTGKTKDLVMLRFEAKNLFEIF